MGSGSAPKSWLRSGAIGILGTLVGLSSGVAVSALWSRPRAAQLMALGSGSRRTAGPPPQPSEMVSGRDAGLAEAEQSHRAQYDSLIKRHEAESRNDLWATEAQRSLNREMAQGSKGHFRIVDIDCRSTICVATVEWANYETATDNAHELFQRQQYLGCPRSIILDPPEQGALSRMYRAQLVVDCGKQGLTAATDTLPNKL